MTSSTTRATANVEASPTGAPSSRMARVWLFNTALAALAVLAWSVVFVFTTELVEHPWPWYLFVVLFAVGRQLRVELKSVRGDSMSFVMTDLAFVASLLLTHYWVIPVGLIAAAAVSWASLRPRPVKAAFNLAQELAGAGVGELVFVGISDDRVVSARTGFAAIAAGLALGLFSHQAVAFVTRLASGTPSAATMRSLAVSTIGSLGHGVIAVCAVYLGYIALPLALMPLIMVGVVYAGYATLRTQQRSTDRTETLYRATAALYEESTIDDGLLSALQQFRATLRASAARLVLLADSGAVTCGVSDADAPSMPMTAAQPVEESAARRLATELPGAVLLRGNTPAVVSGPMSVFATSDAIAAPISRGGRPAGIVIVYGRHDAVDALGPEDVQLVELMATQIGSALERGFLERSVAQIVELERELSRTARYDAVTNLPNRRMLIDELDQIRELPNTAGHALLVADLDDFKTVNDSLGHFAGDQLLSWIAQRLVGYVGNRGLVARLGGDEFAVVLTDVGDAGAVDAFAAGLLGAIAQQVRLDGRDVSVAASIGIRMVAGGDDRALAVLRDADLAMNNAKALGKGRCVRYEPAMHVQAQERLELLAMLTAAVEREEFVVAYQPVIDLRNGAVVGAEALVRWNHPERGQIPPAYFLAMAEETGLIVPIGEMVLRTALATVAEWLPIVGDDTFSVSVNVSARQLREPDIAESLLRVVEASGVPANRLCLELTESMFIDDPVRTTRVLETLTTIGARIGLDDFGTGFSSLSQLQSLPLDQLKIDRSFVRRLVPGEDGRVVVSAIIQLAEALGLETVAEGIETRAQYDELAQLGCHRGQGWLMGRPLPAAEFVEVLRRGIVHYGDAPVSGPLS